MTSEPSTIDPDPICPLCSRPIPKDAKQSVHHLVPKLKGGRGGPTVTLHHICHVTIHSQITEAELARKYPTIEALHQHEGIAKFVEWIKTKDPYFYAPTRGRRRGRSTSKR